MAQIKKILHTNDKPQVRTQVVADYCFDQEIFQLRTYKQGDTQRTEGQKQNVQLDKKFAKQVIKILEEFVK